MKKGNKTENSIEMKGDGKIVIQNVKESTVEIENTIKVEGNSNIVIQDSGSSQITIDEEEF